MNIALRQIFEKKLRLWICLLFLFGSLKVFSMYITEKYYPNYEFIDLWIEESNFLSEENLAIYVKELAQEINCDEQYRKLVGQDYTAFLKSYKNHMFLCNLISFAENGEGVLSARIPDDFENLQDFYKKLDAPSIINEQPLNRYYFLQSINVVPIIVLILSAIVWGEHYENGVDKATLSTVKGKPYHTTLDVTLIIIGACFLTANEMVDLWYSGLLRYKYLWRCSVQSYDFFRYSQLKSSMGTVMLISFVSKLVGVFCLSSWGSLVAKRSKSVKESVIWSIFILIAILFFAKGLENTKLYPLVQIGIIDWKLLISKIAIFEPLHLNTLSLGLILICLITMAFYGYSMVQEFLKLYKHDRRNFCKICSKY